MTTCIQHPAGDTRYYIELGELFLTGDPPCYAHNIIRNRPRLHGVRGEFSVTLHVKHELQSSLLCHNHYQRDISNASGYPFLSRMFGDQSGGVFRAVTQSKYLTLQSHTKGYGLTKTISFVSLKLDSFTFVSCWAYFACSTHSEGLQNLQISVEKNDWCLHPQLHFRKHFSTFFNCHYFLQVFPNRWEF